MGQCLRCYADRSLCDKCIDNPIYKDIPKTSKYQDYPIRCPYGRTDCIHDPGYEHVYHEEFYQRWYGNVPYAEVKCVYESVCECGEYYDNEDK